MEACPILNQKNTTPQPLGASLGISGQSTSPPLSHRPGFLRLPVHGFVRHPLYRVNGCTPRELGAKIQVRWKEISSECLGPVNDCRSYGDKGLDDICLSNWDNDPGLRRIGD